MIKTNVLTATMIAFSFTAFSQKYLAPVMDNDKWGYIDENCEFVLDLQFQNAKPFSENIAVVKLEDKMGAINKEGDLVVANNYLKLKAFKNGLAPALRTDEKWVYVNTNGQEIEIKGAKKIHDFSEDLALILDGKTSKFGFVNKSGEWVISPTYTKAKSFKDGRASVLVGEKWGFIDKTGEIVIPTKYAKVMPYSDGMARVYSNEQWSYIDTDGKMLQGDFKKLFNFNNGYAVVLSNNGKFGLIDKEGEYVIEPIYDDMKKDLNGKYIGVKKGKLWGICDLNGNLIIEPKYADVDAFQNGLAPVKVKKLWGFANEQGEMVLEPIYGLPATSMAFGISLSHKRGFVVAERARVMVDKKWNYISLSGDKICKGFERAEDFKEVE